MIQGSIWECPRAVNPDNVQEQRFGLKCGNHPRLPNDNLQLNGWLLKYFTRLVKPQKR